MEVVLKYHANPLIPHVYTLSRVKNTRLTKQLRLTTTYLYIQVRPIHLGFIHRYGEVP